MNLSKRLLELIDGNIFLKKFSFWAVNLPIINFFYVKQYNTKIKQAIAVFKLSDLVISIETINTCNAKCLMCPYEKMTRKKELMPINLFKKIVDDCVNEDIKIFNLSFYNEPFLDPFIFERVAYVKSKGARAQFFSNASVMDEEKANQALESGLDRINFSVDGARKETYETIRQGLNYEKMVENILYLVNRKKFLNLKYPKITVVFVKQNFNESDVSEFKSFWEDKVDCVVFSTDDNRNETSRSFAADIKKNTPFPCRKLWGEIIIMSNGQAPLCCMDSDGKMVIGDFNTQTLKEVWKGNIFERVRGLHLDFKADQVPLCKKCVHPYRMNLISWWY